MAAITDPKKAKENMGWEHKYDLEMLVKEMVDADVELFRKDQYLKDGGHQTYDYHE